MSSMMQSDTVQILTQGGQKRHRKVALIVGVLGKPLPDLTQGRQQVTVRPVKMSARVFIFTCFVLAITE